MIESNSTAPRFRWLDRWLEPRWRALLTWVVVAVLTCVFLGNVMHLSRITRGMLNSVLPMTIPVVVWTIGMSISFFFVHCWFAPLALRLSLGRTLLWLAASLVLGLLLVFSGVRSAFVNAALYGHTLGLPGLVIIGVRSRPWMSIIGGIAAFAVNVPVLLFQLRWGLWLIGLSNLIYGAVMIYGTNPIQRRPAIELHQR